MSFSWKCFLAGLKKLATPRRRARGKGRPPSGRVFVPTLEKLEDRTVLSVSVGSPSGNAVTILGTAGDQLWLQTSSQSGQFQYSTDGKNYANLGVTVAHDATITLGMMQQVHLGQILGQGNAITLQALGVPNGTGGQLASPSLLTVGGTVATGGGNLSVLNMQGIEIDSRGTVSTRNIGPTSTDYVNATSAGDSGALTLTTENPDALNPLLNINFNYPHITVDAGAQLLAQADGGHKAGDVTLTATNTNYVLDGLTFPTLAATVRSAAVTLDGQAGDGAVVEGGNVTISATSGDTSANALLAAQGKNSSNAWQSWGAWVGRVLSSAEQIGSVLPPGLNLLTLPLSLDYRNASTSVTVGQNVLIDGSGNVSIQSAATADATGQAIYSRNSQVGLAVAGMVGITDSETDLKPGAQVISGGNLSLGSNANSTASGTARVSQNLPNSDQNPNHEQIAFSFGYSQQTAHTTLENGATVQAAGNVDFEANGTYSNSQSSTSASYKDGVFGSAFAVSTSKSDVQANVDGTMIAGGTTAVPALTVNPFTEVDFPDSAIQVPAGTAYTAGQSLAYDAGPGGGAIGGLVSGQTYYVVPFNSTFIRLAATPADAAAGTYIHLDQYPTLVGGANITPITDVTDEQNGVINFGFNPGFADGEAVTYHAVAGKYIGGLVDGTTYYVISHASSPDTIQLSATAPNSFGADGSPIPLNLDPSFTTTTSATPFRQSIPVTVNPQNGTANSIQFGCNAGFQLGDHFTYQGSGITGLTPGTIYWVIPTSDPTVIQLAATPDDADNGNAITLGPDNSAQTLTFDPALSVDSDTNTIDLGFNYALSPSALATGTALTYSQALGLVASGLQDGTTYYLVQDPADPRIIRLAPDAGAAQSAYDVAVAAYNAAYNQVYSNYLAANPGDTTGATAAANAAAQNLGETWTNSAFASARQGTASPVGVFQVAVDANANTLDFGFDPGLVRNQPLVYQGPAAGSPGITGLTPGTIYYVHIADPENHPGVIQLADAQGNVVPLSLPSGTTTSVNFGTLTSVDVSVDPANNTLTLDDPSDPFDPGFHDGDPFAYEGPVDSAAGDVDVGGLKTGTVYHVKTTATPGVIQLTDDSGNVVPLSLPNGTTTTNINYTLPFAPVDSRPHLVVDFGTLDDSVLTGTAQTFTPPAAAAGITVKATLTASDGDKVKAGLGKDPKLTDALSKPEVKASANFGIFALATFGHPTEKLPPYTGAQTPVSVAPAVLVEVALNSVQADVGPEAVLESASAVTVGTTLTEKATTAVSASISKPKPQTNGQAPQQQKSVAVGLSLGYFQQTDTATVEQGAQIDAAGKLSVTATTTYPFVLPLNSSDAQKALGKNPLNFLTTLVTDGTFGLAGLAVNNAGSAAVKDEDSANAVGVAGNIQVNVVNNDTEAVVNAARINQKVGDPTYGLTFRNPDQSVAVDAETDYYNVAEGGNLALNLAPSDLVKAYRAPSKNLSRGKSVASTLFNPVGDVTTGPGGIGVGASVFVETLTDKTVAEIKSGAKVGVGPSGTLDVGAAQKGIAVSLVQAGGAGGDIGVIGAVSAFNVTDTTTAQIEDGVTVNSGPDASGATSTGGGVAVHADDSLIVVGVTGGVLTSSHVGVGFAVAINTVERTTLAVIGSTTTTTPANSGDFQVSSLGVNATAEGYIATLTYAGSQTGPASNQPAPPGNSPLDGIELPNLFGDINPITEEQHKSGYAISGDASGNVVTDDTEASINDPGTFTISGSTATDPSAGAVTVHAAEQAIIVSVAGAYATAAQKPVTSSGHGNLGVAGSFSSDDVIATTKASIDNATIQATTLDVTAEHGGFIGSLTAGAAGASGRQGTAVAGSVSVDVVLPDTEAYVRGAQLTLAGDSEVKATDDSEIWSVAGNGALGGQGGYGGAIAVNLIGTSNQPANTLAYITDSAVTLAGGTLSVLATDASAAALPSIASLAGSLGASTQADSDAGAGMVAVNIIDAETDAYVQTSTITQHPGATASLDVQAKDDSWIIAVGGAVGVGGDVGVGAGLSYNQIHANTRAYLDSSTAGGSNVPLDGTVTIQADNNSQITGGTIGVGVSKGENGTFAGAGSVSVNQITNVTDAHVSGSTVVGGSAVASDVNATGAITIKATDDSLIVSVAGGVAGAQSGTAAGAAISYNLIQNAVTSYVDRAAVNSTAGGLAMSATSTPLLVAIAAGGAGGKGFALGGSLTVNSIANTVDTHVTNSTVTAAGDVSLASAESATLVALAGGIAVSTNSAAVGAAIAYNYIGGGFDPANPNAINPTNLQNTDNNSTATDAITAYIDGSGVNAGGNITVTAGYMPPAAGAPAGPINLGVTTFTLPVQDQSQLVSVTVGGSGGDSFALGGSVNLNFVRASVDAHISNTPTNEGVKAGGQVSVQAADTSSIDSGAGALAIAPGGTAVGAAVSSNDIKNQVASRIEGATVSGAEVLVGSKEKANIVNATVAGSFAGSFALGGSVSVNLIRNTVDAHVSGGADVTGSSLVGVTSADTSTLASLSGQGTYAGTVGAGVATAVNDIANTTTATVKDHATGVTATGGNVVVSATSTPTITTVAVGVAVSDTLAIAGSGAVSLMQNQTEATIDAAKVTAADSVYVLAQTAATLFAWAGTLDGSAEGGIGGAIAVNYFGNTTLAQIDDNAIVDAESQGGSTIGVPDWADDASGTQSVEQVRGLAVIASTDETVNDIATTATLVAPASDPEAGNDVGIALNEEVNSFSDKTDADISDATINSSTDTGDSVVVRAHDATNVLSSGGSLATADEAAGAALDVDVYSSVTAATISSSTVYAGADGVEVSALTREEITSALAGAGAGTYAGLAGGASAISIGGSTEAVIDNNSTVKTSGNLTVQASDGIGLTLGDGILAGSVGVGAGGAVAVALVSHATTAEIDTATTDASGTTLVEADTREAVSSTSLAAGGGGMAGIAGAVAIVSLGASTTAAVLAANINQDDSYKTANQNVKVRAKDNASATDHVGGAGVGVTAGVGAGVDVIVITDTVDAHVGDGSKVSAGGDITVESDGDKTFSSQVFSFAFSGTASANGTVSLVGIGTGLDGQGVSQLHGIQDTVNNNISLSNGAPGLNANIASAQNAQTMTASNALNVNGALGSGQTPSGTAAYVGKNAVLKAGGAVSVTATEALNPDDSSMTVDSLIGQGTGSEGLSVGGSLADVAIGTAVQAFVEDGARIDAGGAVTVQAGFTDTVTAQTYAGTAGGDLGLGAQVSIITDNATESATLGDAQVTRAGVLGVAATADRTLDAEAAGGTAGSVAAGAAVADAYANGSTTAQIAAGAQIGQAKGESVGAVSVSAASADTATADTTAIAAGIGTGTANVSQATIDPNVMASIGANADVTTTPQTTTFTPSDVTTANSIEVGNNAAFTTGEAVVYGQGGAANTPVGGLSDGQTYYVIKPANDATAIQLAATPADALAGKAISLTSPGSGSGQTLTTTGIVTVTARSTPHARANSLGVSAAAGAAVGAATSFATDSGNTSASVGADSAISAGALTVDAERTPDAGGDPTAQAAATAGAGGVLYGGADATFVQATAGGMVGASIGDGVQLPDGNVAVMANNQTLQSATTTGVAAGGLLAVGDNIAQASSGVTTSAQLGSVVTDSTRGGNLTVQATGSDENDASATGGSGGAVAGNAALGQTDDTSTVVAGLGGGTIHAGTVAVTATNQSRYTPAVDSINAALLGASGAEAVNNGTTSATTTVGTNTSVYATGAVALTAQNTFTETANGPTVTAGAGGVLSGTAALSESNLKGTAAVTVGDAVTLDVMTPADGMDHRGILLSASSVLETNDQVTLTTGGAIVGAGTNSSLNATLNNNVSIGQNDAFTTNQNIEVGTYTTVDAQNNSEVSTYGLAGVGVADATTDVTSNQTVTVGQNTDLTADFGNVNLTAGDDANPEAANHTTMTGLASAQGYVRGLIAVPTATATTDLTSNATLTVASGDLIQSGQNTTLAADTGEPKATADGTGHGYEAGFIPVTDGTSSPTTATDSQATVNGTVQAGIYHELNVVIPDARNSGIYTDTSAITVNPDGATHAPFTATFDPNFDPASFINQHYNQVDAQALGRGTASTQVGALIFSPLYASGGLVTVNAGTLGGNGSISAYGAPTITVTNNSPDYLVLGTITIPFLPGGKVLFTGTAQQADAQKAGITVSQSPDAAPVVTINQNYPDAVGNPTFGPAVLLTGDVDNLGGAVAINNVAGSVGQGGAINAEQVNITAPNGVLVIDPSSGVEITGASPYSEWDPYMTWPGGNPHVALPDPDVAVAYAANAVYNSANQITDPGTFDDALYHHAGDYPGPEGGPYITSEVFYGNSMPWVGGVEHDSSQTTARNESPSGDYYTISTSADGDQGNFPAVPIEPLTKTVADYPAAVLSGGQASAINAAQVLIHANVIDLNSDISVGQPNAWSVNLPANLQFTLGLDQAFYHSFGVGPIFDLPVAPIVSTDSTITAQYDAATNRIILNNVSASSGGGSLTLDGGILSTDPLGHIHVSGGLGAVTVNNQTGIPVVVQNVFAGTSSLAASALGKVDIIDTNQPAATAQSLYVYQPGAGISEYQGTAGQTDQDLQNGTPISFLQGGSSTSYSPEAGLRWVWQLQASLSRDLNHVPSSDPSVPDKFEPTDWSFNVPPGEVNANDPWSYLGGPNGPSSTPTGQEVVIPDGGAGEPVFQESITGTASASYTQLVGYHNGDFGFAPSDPAFSDGNGQVDPWNYAYIDNVTLTLTNSVKADNPIGIDFSGLTRGAVTIISNAPVYLSGNVVNPDGDTTITAQGGITQAASADVTSNNLTLTAAGGGVGATGQPLNATLTPNGVLNVRAGSQGVYLDLNSGALLNEVAAVETNGYGDVVIHATGSLDPKSGLKPGTVNVYGNHITLASSSGEVGTAATPLLLQAQGTPLADGGASGGVVNASALLGIGLTEKVGDLAVGTITSTAGDVTLAAPNGQIFDASGTTSAQALSSAQIQQVWKNLGLMDTSASEQTVTAFDNEVDTEYQGYWQLLQNGSVRQDGTFTLNAKAVPLYRGLTAASRGVTDPTTVTDDQVQAYAAKQYQSYVGFFDMNLAPDWRTTPDFQTYNSKFSYNVAGIPTDLLPEQTPGTKASDLTNNALWTENELQYAIDRVALNPSAGTVVGNGTPNVSGANVTLLAGQQGGIGLLGAPVLISLADLQAGTLTSAQVAALAVATAPGDVVEEGTDAQGNTQTFPFGAQPSGIKLTAVLVSTTVPLFVSATGTVTANAGGAVYLQGTKQDLTLGQVTAGGPVNITAPRSILSSGGTSPEIATPGDVTLVAGSGSLGSSADPIETQISGQLALASAAQDVYLAQTGSDLQVDRVVAGGSVRLTSAAAIDAIANSGANVQADALVLQAGTGIGQAAAPLATEVSGLAADAGTGGLWLANTGALTIGSSAFDGLTAGGDLSLTNRGPVSLQADVKAGGDVTLAALYTADADADLTLGGGTTVQSTGGAVTLGAGHNFVPAPTSDILAAGPITIALNDGTPAGGAGTTLVLQGKYQGAGLHITTGDDPATITLEPITDTAVEGTPLLVSGAVLDPGPGTLAAGTICTWTVNRDGNPYPLPAGTVTDAADLTFMPDDNGSYVATRTATDHNGVAVTLNQPITTDESDPAVVATGGFTVGAVEGADSGPQTVATFTDPGGAEALADYGATIDWGDTTPTTSGSISFSDGTFTISGSHAYAETGSYPITVTVHHDSAPDATVKSNAAVADAALSATATAVTTAVEGNDFSGEVATFIDANPSAPPSDFPPSDVTIHWGDGTSSAATNVTQPGGLGTAFHVFGSHTYADGGATPQPLTVTVKDVDGAVSNTTSYVPTVQEAPLSGQPVTVVVGAGTSFSGAVASFRDGNPNATSSDFVATIQWGDGRQSSGYLQANGAGSFTVYGTHTYAGAGRYALQVDVREQGSGTQPALSIPSAAQVSAAPVTPAPPAVVSVAFGPYGEVAAVVDGNGVLTLYNALGQGRVLFGSVRSASVASDSQGNLLLLVVFRNGLLYQFDATGAYLLGSDVVSANVAFGPGGEVVDMVTGGGELIQIGSGGGVTAFEFPGPVSSAMAFFVPGGEVLDVVFQNGELFQFGVLPTQLLLDQVVTASAFLDPSGTEVLDVLLANGMLAELPVGVGAPLPTF